MPHQFSVLATPAYLPDPAPILTPLSFILHSFVSSSLLPYIAVPKPHCSIDQWLPCISHSGAASGKILFSLSHLSSGSIAVPTCSQIMHPFDHKAVY